MLAKTSNRSSSHTAATINHSRPSRKPAPRFAAFESLENRQLRSASPVNFAGSYTAVVNGSAIECDLTKAGNRYHGTASENGQNMSISAKLKNGHLNGSLVDAAGQTHSFAAALHGTQLNAIVDGQSTVLSKTVGLSGNQFIVTAPSNWTMEDGKGGMVITSPDKTLRAADTTAMVNQTVTPHDLVVAAQNQGSTIVNEQLLSNQIINGVTYQEEQVVLKFNDQTGTTFGTGLVIDTASFNGQTAVTIRSLTAPASHFSTDAAVLGKVLKSVQQKGQNNSTAQTRYYDDFGNWIDDYSSYGFSGFYDPGLAGDWSYTGGLDYSTNPWLYYEQSAVADSSAAMDQSVANFDAYIME